MWCAIADPRHMLTCKISCQSVYSLPSGGEKNQFLPYFQLRHSVVSQIGSNLRKLSADAQLQTVPYPMVLKSFLYSNAFMAKLGAQTLDIQKRDGQTDKHTKKTNEIRAPPNLAW